jgi:hypothetical protein
VAVEWVFFAAVMAGLVGVSIRLYRDRRRQAPVRDAVVREKIIYRSPVSPQWARNRWERANAKGMELVVREHSFQLPYPFTGGRFLSNEWFYWGKDARIWMGEGDFLPPRVGRKCIVIGMPSIEAPERAQEILVSTWDHRLREAWDALAHGGVTAVGPPPDVGE